VELLDPYSDEGVRVVARVGKWKEGVEERSRSRPEVEWTGRHHGEFSGEGYGYNLHYLH
jgi:hypothetical protein